MLKKFIAHSLVFSLVFNNLAFATHSIIELDFKDSQTPQRLHTILPSSKIADVSHVEIDTEKHQASVYRVDPVQLPEKDKDPSSVHPVLIPSHDIQNLPWEDLLKADRVKAFLLQHTAWLTPLDEDGYTLEFKGGLLGGMKPWQDPNNIKGGWKQKDFNWDSKSKSYIPVVTVYPNIIYPHTGTGGGFGDSIRNGELMQLSNKQSKFWEDQRKKEQEQRERWKEQTRINPHNGTTPFVKNSHNIKFPDPVINTSVPEKYREPIPTGHSLQDEYNTLKDLYDMADWRQWWEIYEEAQKMGVKNTVCNIYDFRKRYEKGLGFSFKDFMSVKEQEAEQHEKIQLQKANPVLYREYDHFREIHRLINTVIYPKVFEYSDPLGYDRAFVRAIDWKKTYAFEGYLQTYYPVFYGDYGQFKEIHRLINSVTYAEVFKYSDPLGYDRGFVKSIDYKKSYTFEGYLQAFNPFYQDYTQLKEIHRLINSVSWAKVFEYSDPLGYDQDFIKSLTDPYYKKPMKLFENYLEEHNPFYQEYGQLKEIHRLINTVKTYDEVFKYSTPLGYDQEFVRSIEWKAPMKPFEGYMTEVFDDQVLEDWGAKNWREVFRPEEGEPRIMQVGLIMKILQNAPKGVGLIKQGWQKAIQAYKGDLVKGLKIDKPVENKLTQELGKPYLSRDTEGLRWGDIKGNNQVRIMKGDPSSDFLHQQKNYVQLRSGGKVVLRDGTKIDKPITGQELRKLKDAHIPYEEYIKWKNWDKP